MSKIFNSVQGNHPGLNRFNLSYSDIFSAKIGMLYPVMCDEVYPGDVFKMDDAVHVECQPLVAPLMSDLNIYTHAFFVPYRLIYGIDNSDGKPIFEKFITGGQDGLYDTPLPTWHPSFSKSTFSSETIWDSVGLPVKHSTVGDDIVWTPVVPGGGIGVSVAPRLAYNFIWNEFYRDENLQDEIASTNEDLQYVAWTKDYFTSALEYQQRGIAPALPLSGKIPLTTIDSTQPGYYVSLNNFGVKYDPSYSSPRNFLEGWPMESGWPAKIQHSQDDPVSDGFRIRDMSGGDTASVVLTDRYGVDLSGAATFTITDLRLAFATQRLQELSMRSGVRFTEYLHAHFGVSPSDERLDRPEYIGGAVFPINMSPVVQTSGSDLDTETPSTTAQGNKTGNLTANGVEHIGNYRVLEHGLIMKLMSIRLKPSYHQGINRQWLRQDRFSYYSPEFANLSESGIYNCELYTDGTSDDGNIFGYQACWNELRCKNNLVSGALHDQFSYWAMFRHFTSRPALNSDFITMDNAQEFNRCFAVRDEDQFIVAYSNIIDAYRPIPATGTPGLVDHVYGGI